MRRYYALLLCSNGTARLVKCLDGEGLLATTDHGFELGRTYQVTLEVTGDRIRGTVDGRQLFDLRDNEPLLTGGIGLVVADGRATCETVVVGPGRST